MSEMRDNVGQPTFHVPIHRCKSCGCLWRDNLDDTVSLLTASQASCAVCEHTPTRTACKIVWVTVREVPIIIKAEPAPARAWADDTSTTQIDLSAPPTPEARIYQPHEGATTMSADQGRIPFSDLRAKMSPEAQARAAARTQEILSALPPPEAPRICDTCRTQTHCEYHGTCLAECEPKDLSPARLGKVTVTFATTPEAHAAEPPAHRWIPYEVKGGSYTLAQRCDYCCCARTATSEKTTCSRSPAPAERAVPSEPTEAPKPPTPRFKHGDTVHALNYRRRPEVWEPGTVTSIEIRDSWGRGWSVSYRVRLTRTTTGWRRERTIDLHVGEAGIR